MESRYHQSPTKHIDPENLSFPSQSLCDKSLLIESRTSVDPGVENLDVKKDILLLNGCFSMMSQITFRGNSAKTSN